MNQLNQLEAQARIEDLVRSAEKHQLVMEAKSVQSMNERKSPVYGSILAATGAVLVNVGKALEDRYGDDSIDMSTIPQT